ncbi:hypothetical protein FGG08_004161 [Glutinoglossum americanum]|uniref:Alpha/beta hydrolase fold-3 domain-containing protein n=1 Tax=Glutinoglossum americanum TaxID=1670608 RepID=A0A9P8IBZ9_9PEZI|nr:hypothetical protein FGG08_004161 [Glutinoglossum americanum]
MGSAVSLAAGQKATINPEAAIFLGKIPRVPFASFLAPFLTGPRRIPGFRDRFKKVGTPIEESIIAKYNLRVKRITIAEVSVVVVEPPHIEPDNTSKIILNIHGGAFVLGSARDRTSLLMAAEMGIRVYSIDYSLSPEVRYPVARDQCLTVYRHLVRDFDPKDILGMGSSSGGQLILSMLLLAHREELPMPTALYLCTPAADLSGDGDSMIVNAARDVMPTSFLAQMVRQNYANSEVDDRDELYSPVFAHYEADFPPTIITVGTRDCLLSSGVRLYWKLRAAGAKAELLISEGMWHAFDWETEMPEAVCTRAAVRTFLTEHTPHQHTTPDPATADQTGTPPNAGAEQQAGSAGTGARAGTGRG